jgi:hypothetical protein
MHTLLKAAAAAAIIAVAAAGAQAGAEEREVSVSGANPAIVHARIVHAARQVCEADYVRGAHRRADLEDCIEATVDDAVVRARRADLAAYHQQLAAADRYRDRYETVIASAD